MGIDEICSCDFFLEKRCNAISITMRLPSLLIITEENLFSKKRITFCYVMDLFFRLHTALSRDLIHHFNCFNYNIVARRAPPV